MAKRVIELQLDEVVAYVTSSSDQACAIVHTGSGREAELFSDDEKWLVRASLKEKPATAEVKAFKSIGLKPGTREMIMRFGPRAGEEITLHLVSGSFKTLEAAASAGLALVRLLAGSPGAWLWVASSNYDARPQPPSQPTVWPPKLK